MVDKSEVEELKAASLAAVPKLGMLMGNDLEEACRMVLTYSDTDTVFDIQEKENIRDEFDRKAAYLGIVELISRSRLNVKELVSSSRNLLNPSDSNSWQAGYRKALADYILSNGYPVVVPESVYGWMDRDFAREGDSRKPVAVMSVSEDSWSTFEDTYVGNTDRVGVSAVVVYDDGAVRKLRYETSFEKLMRSLLFS